MHIWLRILGLFFYIWYVCYNNHLRVDPWCHALILRENSTPPQPSDLRLHTPLGLRRPALWLPLSHFYYRLYSLQVFAHELDCESGWNWPLIRPASDRSSWLMAASLTEQTNLSGRGSALLMETLLGLMSFDWMGFEGRVKWSSRWAAEALHSVVPLSPVLYECISSHFCPPVNPERVWGGG